MSHLNNANSPIDYTPVTPGNWVDPDPTDVQEALDTLASEITSLQGSLTEKSWTFSSPAGSTGTFYVGGFYNFASLDNDFSPLTTFGVVNNPYAAHLFVVVGAIPVDTVTITITGTSITDAGVRTALDTENIILTTGNAVDDYSETTLKWLGQISIETVSGTPVTCNYGWSKYWDDSNRDFVIKGFEATWVGGANDATANLHVHKHSSIGWTFNSGAEPSPPLPIATMVGDHGTESDVKNNEPGAWKRTNLNTSVAGSASEGFILEIIVGANKAFELANFILSITKG